MTTALHVWQRYAELLEPVAVRKLTQMAYQRAVEEPIVIASTGLILDRHELWLLARSKGAPEVLCLEYAFATEREAVFFLLEQHLTRRTELNPFVRVTLAMEAEPFFQQLAHERQGSGRTNTGLPSDLTRGVSIDVRHEIAKLAGVGDGQVTKVKQILSAATAEIIGALRAGEITVHRAHTWHRLPQHMQHRRLEEFRQQNDLKFVVQSRIKRHQRRVPRSAPDAAKLIDVLIRACAGLRNLQIHVAITEGAGRRLMVTRDLYDALTADSQPQRSPISQ